MPVALWAQESLTVNDCEDASQFRGGTAEAAVLKQGAGAVRWRPAESVSLETSEIPHDWSGGNVLCFWLHSAKATDSPMWLICLPRTRRRRSDYSPWFRLD